MAEKTMADYLPVKTADYNYTLNITPQRVMPEEGDKKQVVHEYDDGDISVVTVSNASRFDITVQWTALDFADAGTIMDLWHDNNKANGRARTFYWQHPLETNVYVVRFMQPLTRVDAAGLPGHKEIQRIRLRVEGKQA